MTDLSILDENNIVQNQIERNYAHKSLKKWTEDKTIRLIRLFRAKPLLWDPKHKLRYKKTAKPAMWNAISAKLKMSPEECKDKIVNLMSGFRREKAKLLRALTCIGGNWNEGNCDDIRYLILILFINKNGNFIHIQNWLCFRYGR